MVDTIEVIPGASLEKLIKMCNDNLVAVSRIIEERIKTMTMGELQEIIDKLGLE